MRGAVRDKARWERAPNVRLPKILVLISGPVASVMAFILARKCARSASALVLFGVASTCSGTKQKPFLFLL